MAWMAPLISYLSNSSFRKSALSLRLPSICILGLPSLRTSVMALKSDHADRERNSSCRGDSHACSTFGSREAGKMECLTASTMRWCAHSGAMAVALMSWISRSWRSRSGPTCESIL